MEVKKGQGEEEEEYVNMVSVGGPTIEASYMHLFIHMYHEPGIPTHPSFYSYQPLATQESHGCRKLCPTFE